MSLRIVQITDCHVSGDPEALYRGHHPRRNLEALLAAVDAWGPDLVLATGDLSEDAHPDAYAWLAEQFASLSAPVIATLGNHDEGAGLRFQFPVTASEIPIVFSAGGWQVVVLDSSVPGEVPGQLDQQRLGNLNRALAENDCPKLVALHHQPIAVGSPWIDKYPLLDAKGFWDVLGRHPVKAVLWGHIHHAVELEVRGIAALGGPASSCNSLPGKDRFEYDGKGPACRWLELESGGQFSTGLIEPYISTISKSSL